VTFTYFSNFASENQTRPYAPSQLWLQQPGTYYLLTFALVVLYQHSSNISKLTCSDSRNLKPPAPLHPRTLERYTNVVLLLLCCKCGALQAFGPVWLFLCKNPFSGWRL